MGTRALTSLAVVGVLALTGCGGSSDTSADSGETPETSLSTDVETTADSRTTSTTEPTTSRAPTTTVATTTTEAFADDEPVSVDDMVAATLTLADLPDGYVAAFPGPSQLPSGFVVSPCGDRLDSDADFIYGVGNSFTWPTDELGFPAEGVFLGVVARVDEGQASIELAQSTRDALAAGPCELTVEPLGQGTMSLVEVDGLGEVDDALGYQFLPFTGSQSLLVYRFTRENLTLTLVMDGAAPDLTSLPQLAEPIVAVAQQRFLDALAN